MTFPQPHPSLPARPQGSAPGSFKPISAPPTSSISTNGAPGTKIYSNGAPGTKNFYSNGGSAVPPPPGISFTAFKPRSVTSNTNDWRSSSSSISAAPAPPSNFSSAYPTSGYQTTQTQSQSQYPYQQQSYYPTNPEIPAQETPPQIRNPFPPPGQGYGKDGKYGNIPYDPELEAQIAQWQSAYVSKDDGTSKSTQGSGATSFTRASTGTPVFNHDGASTKGDGGAGRGADSKEKTVIRSGGGQSWQDSTLLDWDPSHYRLFVGNLAGEVTDESLLKAFSKYDTVQKARVIRDKRTTKSKGYGFVSFINGDEFFKAAKEMQGKYIGSHPVILRRSTTEVKPVAPTDRNKKGKDNNRKIAGHADTGAGIQKKQNKTKGGLKILG